LSKSRVSVHGKKIQTPCNQQYLFVGGKLNKQCKRSEYD